MAIQLWREGDRVAVPGSIIVPAPLACLVRFNTDLRGNHRDIHIPYCDIRSGTLSVDGAYEASRVLVQRIQHLRTVTVRARLEAVEIGLRGGDGLHEAIRVIGEMVETLGDSAAAVQCQLHELGILTGTGKVGLMPGMPRRF